MTRELWSSLDRRQQELVEVINELGDGAHFGHIIRYSTGHVSTMDMGAELEELLTIGAIEEFDFDGVIYYAEA